MPQLFVRPAGLVFGPDLQELLAGRHALPLAGGRVGWTGAMVSENRGKTWAWRTSADLESSQDAEIQGWVERLTSPRPPVAGMDMSGWQVMGIVNTTPDSFSDGGVNQDAAKAIASARSMVTAGAAIVDIGGESTRPGSDPVDVSEEWQRIGPVLETAIGEGIVVSCDTRKSQVMEMAVAAGVRLINDVSALTYDERAAGVVGRAELPVCLMHAQGDPKTMQDNPTYDDVLLDVFEWLHDRIEAVVGSGIARGRIIADPGIGFGKSFQHNLQLLQGLSLFHGLGVPLIVGASRKGFIGAVTGEKIAAKRVSGSVAVALCAVQQGAQIVRVHDVAETMQALKAWQAAIDGAYEGSAAS